MTQPSKHETKPSWFGRRLASLRHLLEALVSVLVSAWASFSKRLQHLKSQIAQRNTNRKASKSKKHAEQSVRTAKNEPPQPPPAPSDEQKSEDNSYNMRETIRLIVESFALVGLLYYAWTTNRMWNEMQYQSCIQREAAFNAERAWVGLAEPPQVTVSSLEEKKYTTLITLPLKNFGKGPAFNVFGYSALASPETADDAVTTSCDLIFSLIGLKPSRPVGSNATESFYKCQPGVILYPQQPFNGPLELQPNDSSAIFGKQHVHVVGCVVYRDQFGNPHWTKFSYVTERNQVVRDSSAFKQLFVTIGNNYTDDAGRKPACSAPTQIMDRLFGVNW